MFFFILLINVKMPTVVKCWHFDIYEHDTFLLISVEHEQVYNLGARLFPNHLWIVLCQQTENLEEPVRSPLTHTGNRRRKNSDQTKKHCHARQLCMNF